MENEETDQVEQLRRILAEVEHGERSRTSDTIDQQLEDEQDNLTSVTPKIDVLNLPPRKEVHGKVKNRTRLRIGQPFLRLLIVILILIIIALGTYIYLGEELIIILENI